MSTPEFDIQQLNGTKPIPEVKPDLIDFEHLRITSERVIQPANQLLK
jgi:hypothetical protein